MKRCLAASAALLALLPASRAQESLPAGTVLPVTLITSVNSSKDRVGQRITARVMQAVSAGSGLEIPAGAKVVGHIVRVEQDEKAVSQLSVRFDSVVAKKGAAPLNAGLRAIASYVAIESARIPTAGADADNGSYGATTVQIGGDVRYGTGGPVMEGGTRVGIGVAGGVIATITAQSICAQRPSTKKPQSLWLFSSSACGVFDLPDVTIQKSGLTQPVGEIVLRSFEGPLKLPSGTGLLLQVADTQQ